MLGAHENGGEPWANAALAADRVIFEGSCPQYFVVCIQCHHANREVIAAKTGGEVCPRITLTGWSVPRFPLFNVPPFKYVDCFRHIREEV